MSMLNRRLQILVDEDRYRRLEERARRRGVPVAVVVREAIDRSLAIDQSRRATAARHILGAEDMPVPDDPTELKGELEELRGRHRDPA